MSEVKERRHLNGFELSRGYGSNNSRFLGLSHSSFKGGSWYYCYVSDEGKIKTFDYELTVEQSAVMVEALQLASAIAQDFGKYWEAE